MFICLRDWNYRVLKQINLLKISLFHPIKQQLLVLQTRKMSDIHTQNSSKGFVCLCVFYLWKQNLGKITLRNSYILQCSGKQATLFPFSINGIYWKIWRNSHNFLEGQKARFRSNSFWKTLNHTELIDLAPALLLFHWAKTVKLSQTPQLIANTLKLDFSRLSSAGPKNQILFPEVPAMCLLPPLPWTSPNLSLLQIQWFLITRLQGRSKYAFYFREIFKLLSYNLSLSVRYPSTTVPN